MENYIPPQRKKQPKCNQQAKEEEYEITSKSEIRRAIDQFKNEEFSGSSGIANEQYKN